MKRRTPYLAFIVAFIVWARPAGASTIVAQTDFGTVEGTNIAPFISDYSPGFSFPAASGQYDVSINATGHGVPPWGGVDHTSGTGCFMLVNGATTSANAVVACPVATRAGYVYTLQGWAQNVYASGTNPPVFRCRVDGIEIGTFSPAGGRTWQAFTFRYTNVMDGTRLFALHDINTGAPANDFGLDDLAVYAEPLPATAWFSGAAMRDGSPILTITNASTTQTAWVDRAGSVLDSNWVSVSTPAVRNTNWTDAAAGIAWTSLVYRLAEPVPAAPWYVGIVRTNLIVGRRTNDIQLNNIRLRSAGEQAAVGFLWLCAIPTNGAGAAPSSDWLNTNGAWDYTRKPRVTGAVWWASQFHVSLAGTQRLISGNGLPSTPTGTFPIPSNSLAFRYDRNANAIQTQNVDLAFAAQPVTNALPTCMPYGANGIALSGAAIYHGASTLGTDAAAFEMLDDCGGHTDGTGTYHYHMLTDCLLERYDTNTSGHSALIGYMMDGFGLFGPRGEDGHIMLTNELDECHGHTHLVDWDGQPRSIYHYHWLFDFPYNAGCMRGTPVTPWNGLATPSPAHAHPHLAVSTKSAAIVPVRQQSVSIAIDSGKSVQIDPCECTQTVSVQRTTHAAPHAVKRSAGSRGSRASPRLK